MRSAAGNGRRRTTTAAYRSVRVVCPRARQCVHLSDITEEGGAVAFLGGWFPVNVWDELRVLVLFVYHEAQVVLESTNLAILASTPATIRIPRTAVDL